MVAAFRQWHQNCQLFHMTPARHQISQMDPANRAPSHTKTYTNSMQPNIDYFGSPQHEPNLPQQWAIFISSHQKTKRKNASYYKYKSLPSTLGRAASNFARRGTRRAALSGLSDSPPSVPMGQEARHSGRQFLGTLKENLGRDIAPILVLWISARDLVGVELYTVHH
jgi:hypothetical protein